MKCLRRICWSEILASTACNHGFTLADAQATCPTRAGIPETILEHMLHDHSLDRDMHWNTFGHSSLTMNGLTTQQQMRMHNQADEWLHRS